MELSELLLKCRNHINAAEAHYCNDEKTKAAESLATLSVVIQDNLRINHQPESSAPEKDGQ